MIQKIGTLRIVFFVLLTTMQFMSNIASNNPFMQFADKPYSKWRDAVRDSMEVWKSQDSGKIRQTLKYMREVPDKFNDAQWELEAGFIETKYDFKDFKEDTILFLNRMYKLIDKAERINNKVFQLRLYLWMSYFYYDAHQFLKSIEFTYKGMRKLNEVRGIVDPDI